MDGRFKTKHGLSRHPLYRTWMQMMQRCYNSKSPVYYRYGGRGIEVCKRWQDVAVYIQDIEKLGSKPSLTHTLDRIDNNGNYELSNIRWATKSQQAQNRRIPLTNTSGIMGVTYDSERNRWVARKTIDGKRHRIGRYRTKQEAALALTQL